MKKNFEVDDFDKAWVFGFSVSRLNHLSPSTSLLNYLIKNHSFVFPGKTIDSPEIFLHSLKIGHDFSSMENIALLFGCHKRTALSWASKPSSIRPINKRLMKAIKDLCEKDCKNTSSENSLNQDLSSHNGIEIWKSIAREEAKSRGIIDLFKSNSWREGMREDQVDRITGKDINDIRSQLGLSVMDACWVYGMEPKVWNIHVKNSMGEAVKSVQYCLLTRFLRKFPDLCPLKPSIGFKELIEKVEMLDPLMCSKKMAVLLGCEGSSGLRWMKNDQAIDSANINLIRMVNNFIFTSRENKNSDFSKKNLSEWEEIVLREAEYRKVDKLMNKFKWH